MGWLLQLAVWMNFLTLTFREETPEDIAWKRWRRLVRVLNEKLVGKHNTKGVGHSYFSYVLGLEEQTRGVVLFHALVDRPVNFARICSFWTLQSGFAHTDIFRKYGEAVRYITKHVLKGGDLRVYKAKTDWMPRPRPVWLNDFDPGMPTVNPDDG